jgi:valyl-tRNA synthetase
MIDNEKELERLVKQSDKLKKELDKLESRISNQAYVNKAPSNIIASVRTTIAEKNEQLS